jgi:hypothetical protein
MAHIGDQVAEMGVLGFISLERTPFMWHSMITG